MLRPRHLLAPALVTIGLIGACTNDFSQFEPDGSTTTTATTGGNGGSGGAGPTVTTTTTTTTNPMVEADCTDGVDNDMDGDADCADTADCGGFTCVTVPPGGWQGPGILYAGDPATLPDCPADFPDMAYEGVADPVQEDAMCEACSCGAPTVDCTLGQITAYNNNNCTGSSQSFDQPPANTCAAIDPPFNTDSYRAPNPTVTASACAPSGGAAMVPPPVASVAARVCSADLSDAGCGTQAQRCVPTTVGTPFESAVCIWSDGDQSCPGDFSVKHLFGADLDDTRTCTPCTCGDAQATCTATTFLYSDDACANQVEMVPNAAMCVIEGDVGSIMTTVTTTGMCPPDGGQPMGSVDLGGAMTTVCCRQ